LNFYKTPVLLWDIIGWWIVSHDEWLKARLELLAAEKEFTPQMKTAF
jgi:predicted dithiol-disulfide oxidoreductase (DUF899 family)